MGESISIERVEAETLHLDQLPAKTRRAFLRCTKMPFFSRMGWYLAGGTALALQAGHRQSVDLDFFTPQPKFSDLTIERDLVATGEWKTTYREKGTFYGELLGAKMSFIAYPFFKPSPRRIACGHVRILLADDIAAMKIVAISQRGRKRDFVDLYWYVQHREPIVAVLRRAVRQYPGQEHNLSHILKSLTYFTDAENDPMPRTYFNISWRTIKAYFNREIPRVAKELLL